MTRWALMRGDAVLTVIEAEDMPTAPGPDVRWLDAATLTPPEPPEPEPAPEPPPEPVAPPEPLPAPPPPLPRWAYVWNGQVIATKVAAESPLGDEGGEWLPCPDECTTAWTVTTAGAFVPPAFVYRPVPASVTNVQARAVLLGMPGPAGVGTMFDAIDAALREAGGVEWQFWEYSNVFTRGGPLVNAMAAQFGITESDLDRLFIAAAEIEA